MADLSQAYDALKKADAAGNTADAKQLADYIRSASPPGKEKSPTDISGLPISQGQPVGDEQLPGFADAAKMVGAIPKGVGNALTGIGNAVQHPIDAVTGLVKKIPGAIDTAAGAVMHPVNTAGKVGDYLKNMKPEQAGETVGSMLTGGAAGKAAGVLGDMVGPAAKAAVSGAPKVGNSMVDVARNAGYVLKPSEAGGGAISKGIEGVAGSPRLSVANSVKNQTVTNRLAGEEIGVKGKLTKSALKKAKAPHNAVYKEMQSLGDVATDPKYSKDIQSIGRTPGNSFANAKNPDIEKLRTDYDEQRFDSKDGVLKIRELRASANKNIKAPFDPAKNELGYAQKQIANAIEAQMERHAAALGKTDLVTRFKKARQELAKIHNVEDALVGNTGDVSPKKLSKMQERGAPLSGKLKTIADVHDEFNESMRTAKKVPNKVPVTLYDALTGGGRTAVRKLIQHPKFQDRLRSRQAKPAYTPIGNAAPLAGALTAPGTDEAGVAQ
jgi:hypothetical protein